MGVMDAGGAGGAESTGSADEPAQSEVAGPARGAAAGAEQAPASRVGSPVGSPVGSVDKALVLLEILGEAGPEGLMLREIAAESGLNKGSVHRLLRALAYRRYAQQGDHDQRYRLGPAPLGLAESFTRGENLQVLFAPALAGISLRTQELVHLGRLEGADVVYLDKVEPERTLRVWSRVGSRAPAARTALGRALLAADGVSGPQLAPYAQATGEGEGAIPAERLQEIISATRQRGWSVEYEENEPGIACVGIALTRPDGHSVAVSITGPVERMGEERRAEVAQLLGEELSRLSPPGFTISGSSQ